MTPDESGYTCPHNPPHPLHIHEDDGTPDGDYYDCNIACAAEPQDVAPEPHIESRRVDVGNFCVECRNDTSDQKSRTPATREAVDIETDEEGNRKAVPILLAGWLCENCTPFENPLIEDMAKSLIERNFDSATVRQAMRALGEEALWEHWVKPMLDTAEVALGLEYR